MKLGRIDDAVAHYKRVLAIHPDNAEAHHNLANQLKVQGKFDEALAHYDRAIAVSPPYAEAHFRRTEIKTYQAGDAELDALEALAADRIYQRTRRRSSISRWRKPSKIAEITTRAFEHLRKGNDLKRRQVDYDEPAIAKIFPANFARVFDGGLFDRFRGQGRSFDRADFRARHAALRQYADRADPCQPSANSRRRRTARS